MSSCCRLPLWQCSVKSLFALWCLLVVVSTVLGLASTGGRLKVGDQAGG